MSFAQAIKMWAEGFLFGAIFSFVSSSFVAGVFTVIGYPEWGRKSFFVFMPIMLFASIFIGFAVVRDEAKKGK